MMFCDREILTHIASWLIWPTLTMYPLQNGKMAVQRVTEFNRLRNSQCMGVHLRKDKMDCSKT